MLSKHSLVSAPARLHLGLIDCGYATMRLYGGSGICLEGPRTLIAAKASKQWELEYPKNSSMSDRSRLGIESLIELLQTKIDPLAIHILQTAPEHQGLGSKTTLLLSIAAACLSVYQPSLSTEEVVKLTKRGGASGIGINSFWTGGFLVDSGHAASKEREFGPSSSREPQQRPSISVRLNMPTQWVAHLFYDPNSQVIDGIKERKIFQHSMPIDDSEVFKALAATYHGVVPAIQSINLTDLADALKALNSSGMKAIEVRLQTTRTKEFLQNAWSRGHASGLSSFGPIIFGIEEKDTPKHCSIQNIAFKYGLVSAGTYNFDNKGVTIYANNEKLKLQK